VTVQLGGQGFTPQQRFLMGGTDERADGALWRRPGRRSPNGSGLYIRVAVVLGAPAAGGTLLHGLVAAMLDTGADVHVLRDPTRGGLAASLNEIVSTAGVGIEIVERQVPVPPEVTAEHPAMVVARTGLGATRVVDLPVGEQLPRIC
jgi:hypothetical protein